MEVDSRQTMADVPMSIASDPIWDLLRERVLDAPRRPGVAASLDRFDIFRCLGRGGMGVVLLARDTDGEHRAIKLLRPELIGNDDAAHRFEVEAMHLRQMEHPNILPLLELGQDPHRPYFVMPFIGGGSLARLIEHEPLDGATALRIAVQLAEALAYAHARGITHRDVKPGNILLDGGRVFLTDFGLGRTVYNDSIIDVQKVPTIGTPAYMAPEVAAGKAGDTRCDTYSFGAVLYEMLTGQPPYSGQSPEQVLAKVRSGPPVPIQELNPRADARLAAVTERAMARDLGQRYSEMSEALADLKLIDSGHQPRCRRCAWPPRRRILTAGLAVLILAAISTAIVLYWTSGPFTIHVPPNSGMRIGDFDRDASRDFFVCTEGLLKVISASGRELARKDLRAPGRFHMRLDMTGDFNRDGSSELLLDWVESNQITIGLFDSGLVPVRTFNIPFRQIAGARHAMQALAVADLDDDDHRELYALVGSDSPSLPRGLACFDLSGQSTAPEWFFKTGPSVEQVELVDLNGDGKQDLLLGTYAPDNGLKGQDGLSDNQCYIYALDRHGRPVWPKPFQPGETRVYCGAHPLVADLNGDGQPEIYVYVEGSPDHRTGQLGLDEVGRVYRLDKNGQQLSSYDAGATIRSCLAADISGTGTMRLVVTDRVGNVHILGPDLAGTRQQLLPLNSGDLRLVLHDCRDVNGDGRPELIFTASQVINISGLNNGMEDGPPNVREYRDNQVIVTDSDLRVLSRHLFARKRPVHPDFRVQVLDLEGDGRLELVVFADGRIVVLRPAPASDRRTR